MKKDDKIKKNVFLIVFIILCLLFIDLAGQAAYRLIKGRFTWDTYKQYGFDIFNIRIFTEFVEDDRLVTIKKNFTGEQDNWLIKTDANRFRIGKNKYFNNKENFVFLGDSVPFGWGVNGDINVPSKFYEIIKANLGDKYGVINAAIPSYSLYQSVKRYQFEINRKFPVKYVILQIYDPAANFASLGEKWDKRICWTSKNRLVSSRDIIKAHSCCERFMHKYSSLYHSLNSFIIKSKERKRALPAMLDLNDKKAFDFFEQENNSVLEELYSMLNKDNITFIILPVNLAKPLFDYNSQELLSLNPLYKATLTAIGSLNQSLKKFALSHKNVYYFDIESYFNKFNRKELFIDSCHLSEKGSQKQAEFIFEQLKNNNLL
ncbi:MAG: SGNH/GDSL hydrolase family protein [Candidatus Omnitrophota bacterium]